VTGVPGSADSLANMDNLHSQTLIQETHMIINIVIYLVVAAVIGWVATEIMHDRSSLLINIIVAVVGAFLAGYFLSPIFKVGTINDAITVPTMLVTLLGAVILLAVVSLFRRRSLHAA